MKCERCNEKEATVFFEQTYNGKTKSIHVCADCAAAIKKEGFFKSTPLGFSTDLFGDLFGFAAPVHAVSTAKKCEGCGATFATIRQQGKVCCPRCYTTFAEELAPTIRSLHGKVTHTGRMPGAHQHTREKTTRLATLREELRDAIAAERFEDAARLRDEIKSMEKEEN